MILLTAARLARAFLAAKIKRLLKGRRMKVRLRLALTITKNGEHWNEFTSAPSINADDAPVAAEFFAGAAKRITKIDGRRDGPFAVTLSLDGNTIAKADSVDEKGVNKIVDLAVAEMTSLRDAKNRLKPRK